MWRLKIWRKTLKFHTFNWLFPTTVYSDTEFEFLKLKSFNANIIIIHYYCRYLHGAVYTYYEKTTIMNDDELLFVTHFVVI